MIADIIHDEIGSDVTKILTPAVFLIQIPECSVVRDSSTEKEGLWGKEVCEEESGGGEWKAGKSHGQILSIHSPIQP
jgi:hypothetical protein